LAVAWAAAIFISSVTRRVSLEVSAKQVDTGPGDEGHGGIQTPRAV
jgi:hypothetical protein